MKILLTLIALVLVSTHVQAGNSMQIGIRIGITEHGSPAWSTARPLIRFSISERHPNQVNKFRPFEAHHGYAGLVLCLFHNKTIRAIGVAMTADDLVQHALRVETPLHMLSDKLGKFAAWRAIQF